MTQDDLATNHISLDAEYYKHRCEVLERRLEKMYEAMEDTNWLLFASYEHGANEWFDTKGKVKL